MPHTDKELILRLKMLESSLHQEGQPMRSTLVAMAIRRLEQFTRREEIQNDLRALERAGR